MVLIGLFLLHVSKVNYGQTEPVMGAKADFELFTTVGAITNNVISQVSGNIGSSGGTNTLFANMNGKMQEGGGLSGTYQADLLISSHELNPMTTIYNPSTLFGNGDTFRAGSIYNGRCDNFEQQCLFGEPEIH